jgi:hypothetical protein
MHDGVSRDVPGEGELVMVMMMMMTMITVTYVTCVKLEAMEVLTQGRCDATASCQLNRTWLLSLSDWRFAQQDSSFGFCH